LSIIPIVIAYLATDFLSARLPARQGKSATFKTATIFTQTIGNKLKNEIE